MDRTIQLEKKYSSEFSSTENTVEVIDINFDNGPFSVIGDYGCTIKYIWVHVVICLAAQVHSLQQLGFLLSVCHSLLLVQDWATDMNLIRLTNFVLQSTFCNGLVNS